MTLISLWILLYNQTLLLFIYRLIWVFQAFQPIYAVDNALNASINFYINDIHTKNVLIGQITLTLNLFPFQYELTSRVSIGYTFIQCISFLSALKTVMFLLRVINTYPYFLLSKKNIPILYFINVTLFSWNNNSLLYKVVGSFYLFFPLLSRSNNRLYW